MATPENKKALYIGINDYDNPDAKLKACVNDVEAMQALLETHEDGGSNFKSRPTSLTVNLTNAKIRAEIELLLKPERTSEHVLFYFSGHGCVKEGIGYLVGRDYTKEDWGVSMDWLAAQLNQSGVPEITVILDCCFAGAMELPSLKQNVTILTSTTEDDTAGEGRKHGFFTDILLQGLNGAAADAFGNITASSLYTLADTAFSVWQQRPVFMSKATKMRPLRMARPLMPPEDFRKLTSRKFFPNATGVRQLKPSDVCTDPTNTAQVQHLSDLLKFQQAGLIECPNNQTIYEAAMNHSHYQLSAFGEFFKEMVRQKKF